MLATLDVAIVVLNILVEVSANRLSVHQLAKFDFRYVKVPVNETCTPEFYLQHHSVRFVTNRRYDG